MLVSSINLQDLLIEQRFYQSKLFSHSEISLTKLPTLVLADTVQVSVVLECKNEITATS